MLSHDDFFLALCSDLLRQMHCRTTNNYDHYFWQAVGAEHPDQFNLGMHASYMSFFLQNSHSLHRVYSLLEDQESRRLFGSLVLYRILGHHHVVIKPEISYLNEKELIAAADVFAVGLSECPVSGMFGEFRHFEGVPVSNGTVSIDAWGISVASTFLKRQYYFDRDGVRIQPEAGDIVFDVGACFGDTAVCFAKSVGEKGHVHAFDPLPVHSRMIEYNVRQNALESLVTNVPMAVGEQTNDAASSARPASGLPSILSGQNHVAPAFSMNHAKNFDEADIPIVSLDGYVKKNALEKVDFIKMDIEGYELSALKGSYETIARFMPKLAISIYHLPGDYFEIPDWLAKNFPRYRFYIDHYTIFDQETILYAIAD